MFFAREISGPAIWYVKLRMDPKVVQKDHSTSAQKPAHDVYSIFNHNYPNLEATKSANNLKRLRTL